jgi:hypothetical protein
MMDCYCDFSVEFYRSEVRTARKAHRCGECRRTINVGERYQYASGKCEGDMYVAKTCSHCLDLIEWVRARVPCFCLEHGNADECVMNAVEEYSHQAPGLYFGTMRRRVAVRRAAQAQRLGMGA